MKILGSVQKVPGGLMVIPLFVGALINTFAPWLINIGGFTQALGGAGFATLIGAYLFLMGTKVTIQGAPVILKRGFGLLLTKIAVASLVGLAVAKFFGGEIFTLTTLAIIAAMNDTNGGMFLALTGSMGDETDTACYIPQSLETGPFFTMVILAGAGLANIPYMALVSVIAPVILGAILGNLDHELRDWCNSKSDLFIPFFAFALGNNINLGNVVAAGFSGVLLGIATIVITGGACYTMDRLLGGRGIAGAAASSTAGNAAATPKAVAMADPAFAAIAPLATLQVAASVIVTAILTPIFTTWAYNRAKKESAAKAHTA